MRIRPGTAVMVLGLTMSVTGVVGTVAPRSTPATAAASAPSTIGTTATTATLFTQTPATEVSPATTSDRGAAVTTTTLGSTTTTGPTTTTTSVVEVEAVVSFVGEFAAAIAAEDVDWLLTRMHPLVVQRYGEALCGDYVAREIVGLGDYQVTGEVIGPIERTYSTDGGSVTIAPYFEAPVSFTFSGQSYDGVGGFAAIEGLLFWFTECR